MSGTAGATEARNDRDSTRTLRRVLLLDLAGVGLFIAGQLLASGRRGAGDFGANPLPATMVAAAMLLIVIGGAFATAALVARPLRSTSGRWAARLAVFNVLFLPAMLAVTWFAVLLGGDFRVSWGMPFLPIWLASGLGAMALGVVDSGERRQGLLLVPALLAAALVTFWLGDMITPA